MARRPTKKPTARRPPAKGRKPTPKPPAKGRKPPTPKRRKPPAPKPRKRGNPKPKNPHANAWPKLDIKRFLADVLTGAKRRAKRFELDLHFSKVKRGTYPGYIRHYVFARLGAPIGVQYAATDLHLLPIQDAANALARGKWRGKLGPKRIPRGVQFHGSLFLRGVSPGSALGSSASSKRREFTRSRKLKMHLRQWFYRNLARTNEHWRGFLAAIAEPHKINSSARITRVYFYVDVPTRGTLHATREIMSDREYNDRKHKRRGRI